MPRRKVINRRVRMPDARYNSNMLAELINKVMICGNKSTSENILYGALDIIKEKEQKDPMSVLEQALKNATPLLEVKARRVGGATYQVPMEVPSYRRMTLAMRWILDASKARAGKSFAEKLSGELMDALNNQGAAIRKREETHKMAEANRAFSHYRV
jgi:small subunit ribosomal protein S7